MFAGISRNLRVYLSSQRCSWLSFLTYRTQAVIWMLVFAATTAASIITISVVYGLSSGIPGWTYYQALALAGLSNMAVGVVLYFIIPRDLTEDMLNGKMDPLLTKPYNPVVMIFTHSGWPPGAGNFASGLALFAFALAHLQVDPLSIAAAAGMFAIGAAALTLFTVFVAVLVYVVFRNGDFLWWLTSISGEAASYPLSIYGTTGLIALTIALPIGLASFYPARLMFAGADYMIDAAVVAIAALLIYGFYRGTLWLLRFYTSAGG